MSQFLLILSFVARDKEQGKRQGSYTYITLNLFQGTLNRGQILVQSQNKSYVYGGWSSVFAA